MTSPRSITPDFSSQVFFHEASSALLALRSSGPICTLALGTYPAWSGMCAAGRVKNDIPGRLIAANFVEAWDARIAEEEVP
jgi:hypothetical protein